ncbi:MAG TPA: bifunctional riboflavin kinase/FAD synthetase [Tepidimicrobium sp.]|nr:bifunctional riboflavin kinase/FAD synthetase [Tepidimicrobium sp.]
MEIIDLDGYIEKRYKTAVALGNFDGIHIGHRYLISSMVKKAKKNNLKSSVLLFKNHTRDILKDDGKLNILTSNEQKLNIIEDLGVKIVYTMKFDRDVMRLTGKEFIENIILKKLNSKLVTIGFDYKFGYRASGDSHHLKEIGQQKGFLVDIIDPVSLEGDIVSSTAIRELIKLGNIEKANKFLGRNYIIEGRVVSGKNRGTKLGFPTANMELGYDYMVPKPGVYKTYTLLNDRKYSSITSIGYSPTFSDDELKIETHILNFNSSIYGEKIRVEFIDFIRDNIKFGTAEELIRQIEKDIQTIQ